LKVRTLKKTALTLIGSLASTPAMAEVCDKVRPSWNSKYGSINQLGDLGLFFSEPVGLFVLGLSVMTFLIGKTLLTAFTILFLSIVVALNVSTWLDADDVTVAAISEGCFASPLLTSIALVSIAILLANLGRRDAVGSAPHF
jgi:hypothetical protein